MMRFVCSGLLVLSVLVSPALAQRLSPRDTEARNLFEAGRLALRDGRFEEAWTHFSRSYELSQRPALLYNMGVAADRLHHTRDALDAFERYLASSRTVENRAEVERRIEILRAVLRPASGPTFLWTFVTGGVSLVAGGLAVGFWIAANDGYASLNASCGAIGCGDAEISGVATNVTLTNAFLIGSLAMAGITAGVFVLELLLTGHSAGAQASLRFGPGSLSVRGTF
jgi:hypothetical protein